MIALRLRLWLRSARGFLFILLFLPSFTFHNFVDSINISSDKSFFLGPTPTFDPMFPLKCLLIRFSNYAPFQFYGAATKSIRFWMYANFMFLNTTFQIFCESSVIGAIRAAKNVNSVWHEIFLVSALRLHYVPRSAKYHISSCSFTCIIFSSCNSSISSANFAWSTSCRS